MQEPAKPTITPCPGSTQWRWPEEDQKEWRELVDDEYLDFYKYWSKPDARSKFGTKFPYPLWLGEGPTISRAGEQIIVTEAYDNMLRRLSHLREEDRLAKKSKGAVITGQPGIGASLTGSSPHTTTHWQIHSLGKTVFSEYLLAQLISTGEVVLFCNSVRILLFFCGKLYRRLTISGFECLPKPPLGTKHSIWTLIDLGDPKGPPVTASQDIWPVQTSSPNPIRWVNWVKEYNAPMLGMGLWSIEELKQGFVLAYSPLLLIPTMPFGGTLSLIILTICSLPLQNQYDAFRARLQNCIFPSATPDPSTAFNDGIAAAVAVVRMDMVRLAEWAAARDRDNGIEPTKADGEDRLPPTLATIDLVFLLLLNNATEELGFAPRDVYDGIFNLPEVKERHANKLDLFTYEDLMTLPAKFTADHLLSNISHHVVAVNPVEFILRRDRWTINFKSPRIAKEVARSMELLEHRHLRDTYHLLHNTSAGSGMAGALFEAIAHRVLCGNVVPKPTPMGETGTPPVFSAPPVLPASTVVSGGNAPNFSLPPYQRTRTRITIDLLRDLRGVTSDSSRYYVPASATNPLFDSFTVALDPSNYSAVVSVFQITTSREHGGSHEGYPLIRKIIAHARGLLKCPPGRQADISVEYILVCPEDRFQHQWTMPIGWDDCNSFNNQVGKGFCIRIPSYHLRAE